MSAIEKSLFEEFNEANFKKLSFFIRESGSTEILNFVPVGITSLSLLSLVTTNFRAYTALPQLNTFLPELVGSAVIDTLMKFKLSVLELLTFLSFSVFSLLTGTSLLVLTLVVCVASSFEI